MMEIALGVLGYTPETFWKMTYPELCLAIRGFSEKNGKVKKPNPKLRDEYNSFKTKLKRMGKDLKEFKYGRSSRKSKSRPNPR